MPVVTVDPNDYTKYDLKSAPPDGYVKLRPLPYGMKLTRRDKASRMMMKSGMPKGGRGAATEQMIELETLNEWATHYDFAYCIGEHNLFKSDGTPIDFANEMEFKLLDPRVGSEIERLINALNEDEDEESLEDFLKRSTSSAQVEDMADNMDSLTNEKEK